MSEEKPEVLWFNGAVVPWAEGNVHVWSELAIRGTSVFEGIRAYWNEEQSAHFAVGLEDHLDRLFDSARLLRIPTEETPETIRSGISELLQASGVGESMYVRPTLYINEGRYGYKLEDVEGGAYVVAFPVAVPDIRSSIRCCVSTWRRSNDLSMPPRAKSGGAYQAFRLPLVEAKERGFNDAILLNDRGQVAEATGAALFIVRNGVLSTPPLTAGVLESITRKIVLEVAASAGIQTDVREIDRTELYLADEIFMCGTLCEIRTIGGIDDLSVGDGGPGPITLRLAELYRLAVDPNSEEPTPWLTKMKQG